MRWIVMREVSDPKKGLPGELFIDGVYECFTLEPARDRPDHPAIPAGTYELTLENSPKFGPDTITVNGVPGRSAIRWHGGTTEDDTEGCTICGDKQDWDAGTIAGAQRDAVLAQLKDRLREGLKFGRVFATYTDP